MILLKFFKKIICFIFKEIFSFFIKLFLFVMLIIFIISGVIYNQKPAIKIKENIFIKINLAEKFPEQRFGINLEFFDEKAMTFYNLLESIEKSIDDNRVEGIVLNLNNISLDYAQIEELGEILTKFKEKNKKPIYSYAENINKKNFYLSSFTDKLFMPNSNSATVNIFPYFYEDFYVKTLTDKLGIKFNIINIGDYKSYQENLSHSFMTETNREDKTRILESKYQEFLTTVSKNLSLDINKFSQILESGELVASSAVEFYKKGFVNNLYSLDEIENEIGKDYIIDIENYHKNYISLKKNYPNKIYVLSLEGEMGGVKENIFDNISHINPDKIIKILDKIKNEKDVKAIVLRVNSPGGSALVADKISKKIEEVAKIKPIYTSMGGIAASGGYYVAANTNKIFVNKNTITGSIGVISIVPEITVALEKLGVNNEKIMKGKYSDLYSASDFNQEKYEKIKESNLRVYKDFLGVVSKGRKIQISELEKIAGGRIWTGEEAIKLGLADKVGGLKDTIREIAKDNNIKDYSVIFGVDEFDLKEFYKNYSDFIKEDKLKLLKSNIKSTIYKDYLFNKPLMYFPYKNK